MPLRPTLSAVRHRQASQESQPFGKQETADNPFDSTDQAQSRYSSREGQHPDRVIHHDNVAHPRAHADRNGPKANEEGWLPTGDATNRREDDHEMRAATQQHEK